MGRHGATRGEQRARSSKKNGALGIREVKRQLGGMQKELCVQRCKKGAKHRDDRCRFNIFEDLNIAVRAPNDANRSTMRSSHMAEDGRMILAPLVNIQKTSCRQNARGYDVPSRMGQKLRKCQDQVK